MPLNLTEFAYIMLTKESAINIEKWNPGQHDRSGFNCGVDRLNNFLNLSAKKQQKDGMTRIYVAVLPEDSTILGYHAINVGQMSSSEISRPPKGTPNHGEMPALFLGQIAVDIRAQGLGIGSLLIHHVFEKARIISDEVGCYAVILDVVSDGSPNDLEKRIEWYRDFGFQSFSSNEYRMFITIKQIREIFSS